MKKPMTAVNKVFTFWIENKISQERKFFVSDIRQQFQKWLNKQDIKWLEYYGCDTVVAVFITRKDGINATYENSQFDELVRLLKPDYKNIVNGIDPVSKLPMVKR